MTQVPSDVAGNSSAAQNGRGRGGATVQMNPAILGQAANTNPEAEAIRQLDMASAMLGEAVTYGESSQPSPGTGEPGGRGEPTIEEYMAALIARTKNVRPDEALDTTASSIEAARSAAARSAVARREAAFAAGGRAASPSSEVSPSATEDSTVEREWKQGTPPECRDAISELRELANISARSSFNVHRGQQLVYEMHNKLTVSLVALVVSFALTALTSSMQSPAYYAAVTALIVAMTWTVKYFQLGRQLASLCFWPEMDEDEVP